MLCLHIQYAVCVDLFARVFTLMCKRHSLYLYKCACVYLPTARLFHAKNVKVQFYECDSMLVYCCAAAYAKDFALSAFL